MHAEERSRDRSRAFRRHRERGLELDAHAARARQGVVGQGQQGRRTALARQGPGEFLSSAELVARLPWR